MVHVFLVEGLSRSLKFFLMSLFLSLSFSLSSVASFFLSFSCCLFFLTPRKKKPKLTRRKSASPLSVPINIGIFSQLFLFLSAVDAGGAARDTKRLTLIVI